MRQNLIRNFNLYFLLGLCILGVFYQPVVISQYLALSFFVGLFNAVIIEFLTHNRYSVTSAFIAGFCSFYMLTGEMTVYFLTLLVIGFALLNVRDFAHKLKCFLMPKSIISFHNLKDFIIFYINLIVSFSVINLSVNALHNRVIASPAFAFSDGLEGIIDALYFSIITMTTVGYGHIYPQTTMARLVVGVECLISYGLLGIMLGIITRGVNFRKN